MSALVGFMPFVDLEASDSEFEATLCSDGAEGNSELCLDPVWVKMCRTVRASPVASDSS